LRIEVLAFGMVILQKIRPHQAIADSEWQASSRRCF